MRMHGLPGSHATRTSRTRRTPLTPRRAPACRPAASPEAPTARPGPAHAGRRRVGRIPVAPTLTPSSTTAPTPDVLPQPDPVPLSRLARPRGPRGRARHAPTEAGGPARAVLARLRPRAGPRLRGLR